MRVLAGDNKEGDVKIQRGDVGQKDPLFCPNFLTMCLLTTYKAAFLLYKGATESGVTVP